MKKYILSINSELLIPAMAGIRCISLKHPVETFSKLYRYFGSDSLYRNSIYLIWSTAIMAFFGFFFWIICARLYTPEQVGIATTLISAMGLITGFSNLGLNTGVVRFLSSSKNKNDLINSSFALSSLSAFILSFIFLAVLPLFSPTLLFLRENKVYELSFILFVVALSNNAIAEALFVAYRSAKYTLVKNSVLSVMKLVLTLVLTALGAYGIFAAVGLANFIAWGLSLLILMKLFGLKLVLRQNFREIRRTAAYSFGNYFAGFIGGLPLMLLPIIITNVLGAEKTAYFYIALMIANFIFMIPAATTTSLFGEGSNDEKKMKVYIIKAMRMSCLILIPAILSVLFCGNLILSAFGRNYSTEAFQLLQLLTVSGMFMAFSYIAGTILKVRNKIRQIIVISLMSCTITLFLSYLFIRMGLLGVGWAWFISQAAIASIYFLVLGNKKMS